MAVYLMRTAEVVRGRGSEAREWAIKVAEYLNANYPDISIEVATNIGASLDQVHWIARYDSLAKMEETIARTQNDEQYMGMVQEIIESAVYTALSDRLFQTQYPQ